MGQDSARQMQGTLMELKYCERCGGLWLRARGITRIYCAICAEAMSELPPASTEVKRRRARKVDEIEGGLECFAERELEDASGGAA